jgi:hypothetical protein
VLLPAPQVDDGTTRLQSAELYEDGLIVRWVALKYSLDLEREHESALELPDPQVRVSDDAGTEYDSDGGGAGAGLRGCRGYAEFVPAPPDNATRLTVIGGSWRGDLQI